MHMVNVVLLVPPCPSAVYILPQSGPPVRHVQKVAVHGLEEAAPVQLRGDDRGHLTLTPDVAVCRLHHHLYLLIPRECPDVVYIIQGSQ